MNRLIDPGFADQALCPFVKGIGKFTEGLGASTGSRDCGKSSVGRRLLAEALGQVASIEIGPCILFGGQAKCSFGKREHNAVSRPHACLRDGARDTPPYQPKV